MSPGERERALPTQWHTSYKSINWFRVKTCCQEKAVPTDLKKVRQYPHVWKIYQLTSLRIWWHIINEKKRDFINVNFKNKWAKVCNGFCIGLVAVLWLHDVSQRNTKYLQQGPSGTNYIPTDMILCLDWKLRLKVFNSGYCWPRCCLSLDLCWLRLELCWLSLELCRLRLELCWLSLELCWLRLELCWLSLECCWLWLELCWLSIAFCWSG